MRTAAHNFAYLLAFFALAACVHEPGIDKDKFSELDRTVRELRTAITASSPCDAPESLQQRLAEGIATVRDRAASKGERDLVAAYGLVLATYQDGLLLCRSRSHLAQLQLIPKGRILVTQELDPLVDKYGLASEQHVYKPTGQMISSIKESSIEVIWDRARVQIKNAENILHYY